MCHGDAGRGNKVDTSCFRKLWVAKIAMETPSNKLVGLGDSERSRFFRNTFSGRLTFSQPVQQFFNFSIQRVEKKS